MPDSTNYHYPPPDEIEYDDLAQLSQLRGAIQTAEFNIEMFTRLRSLPLLKSERIFYTNKELDVKIEHWTDTLANLKRCWNGQLERMKI